jgi:hypothetical protein
MIAGKSLAIVKLSQLPQGVSQACEPPAQYRTDVGEPPVRCQDPLRRVLPIASGAEQKALPDAWRRAGSGAPRENQNALKHGLFTKDAIEERKHVQALIGQSRKLLQDIE